MHNTCARVSFLTNFIKKETLAQVLYIFVLSQYIIEIRTGKCIIKEDGELLVILWSFLRDKCKSKRDLGKFKTLDYLNVILSFEQRV